MRGVGGMAKPVNFESADPNGVRRRVGFYGSPSPKASESPLYALDLTSSQLPRLHRDLQLSKWTPRCSCVLTDSQADSMEYNVLLFTMTAPFPRCSPPVCCRRTHGRASTGRVPALQPVWLLSPLLPQTQPLPSAGEVRLPRPASHLLTGEPSKPK